MAGHASPPQPPSVPAPLPHVYVLDADPAFLEVAADLLVEANVRATLELMNGRSGEVLGRLRAARPDLVIVDVAPHHGDAGGPLAAMAGAGTLAAIPILLASTNPPSAQHLAQAHAALVRAILPKPFDLDDFFAVLRRASPCFAVLRRLLALA